MHKTLRILLAAAMLFSAIVIPSAHAANTEIALWDFEDGDLHGIVNNVNDQNNRVGTADITLATDFAYSGSNSLLASNRTAASTGPTIDVTEILNNWPGKYRVTAWVYSTSGSGETAFEFRFLSSTYDDRVPGTEAIRNKGFLDFTVPSREWTQVTCDVYFSDAAIQKLYLCTTSDVADFYFDDFSFTPLYDEPFKFDTSAPALKDVYKDYFLMGTIITPA